jgi:hypothetical protein
MRANGLDAADDPKQALGRHWFAKFHGIIAALKTLDRARVKRSIMHCMTPTGGSHDNVHSTATIHIHAVWHGG